MIKEAERRLTVVEMKLRWSADNARMDHIRNGDVRQRFGLCTAPGSSR